MSPARRPYAVAARELMRSTLFDAARELLAERPWQEITMADVASAAGVSRQTLYNEFGTRAKFAQAFVLREGELFLSAVERAISAQADDAPAALAAAFDVFLRAAAEDPFVRSLVDREGSESLLPLVTTRGGPVVAFATERLTEIMVATWPQASREDARLLAESLVRLAISHAALPSGPARGTAESLARLLEPFVSRALGRR